MAECSAIKCMNMKACMCVIKGSPFMYMRESVGQPDAQLTSHACEGEVAKVA